MSPFNANYPPLWIRVRGRDLPIDHSAALEYALLDELRFVRREAQAEAHVAYADWWCRPSRVRYAVYLAAQDRADAAQDELAHYTRRVWSA